MKTLYLCYFGIGEPLVQTQVLPYLRLLSQSGIGVSLLTFEPKGVSWSREAVNALRDQLEREGIDWHSRPYHKRPKVLSTLWDVVSGAAHSLRIVRRQHIEVLHARAHVPMAIALMIRRLANCRIVFDIRGLMAEEYADAGTWPEGSLIFRLVKAIERTGIKRADQIVVLTRRMKSWLVDRDMAVANKVEVIPCCVDFGRFRDDVAARPDLPAKRYELIYAGAASGLYLVDEMARFFLELQTLQPHAFFRILTTSPAGQVAARLERQGLNKTDFWVGAVPAPQVPAYLKRARLGISFRKAAFSQIAASPTKIPEYLAAGIPVICNLGVGDMDELVEGSNVGVVVRSFDQSANLEAARKALAITAQPGISDRCTEVAALNFDLVRVGGPAYGRVYQRIREQNLPGKSRAPVSC